MARGIRMPMQGWLAGSHLFTLALPLVALVGTGALATDLARQTRQDLEHQATVVAALAPGREVEELSPILARLKASTLAGFQVVDLAGQVVASSGSTLSANLGSEPEVREALSGRVGTVVRPRGRGRSLPPLGSESRRAGVRIFVAVPIVAEGQVVGAVVVSRTPREEFQALWQMLPSGLLFGALAAVGGAIAVALGSGAVVTRSLRKIAAESRQIADGTLSAARLEAPRASSVAEVAEVAGAITSLVDRLQDRLAYIAEFAGNVSHEFKTPLTTLRGTLELLAEDPAMPAEQRARFLESATAEVLRLDRLVVGLLGLARADAVQQLGEVDLDSVLHELALRFDVRVEGRAGWVVGQEDQLAVAVANLLENARRHGQQPVRLIGFCSAKNAGFEVRDAGPGLSAGNEARVFDRFFTTDRVHGTGLGLALVRAVALRCGGTVSTRREGGETVFRVELSPGGAHPGLRGSRGEV